MDFNVRVNVNLVSVDVTSEKITVTYFCYKLFHFDTFEHQNPTTDPCTFSAKYTQPFWRKRLISLVLLFFSTGGHPEFSHRLNLSHSDAP